MLFCWDCRSSSEWNSYRHDANNYLILLLSLVILIHNNTHVYYTAVVYIVHLWMSILFFYTCTERAKVRVFFPGCCKWSLGSSTLPCDIYVYTITSWLYPAANPTRDSTLCVSHGSLRPVQRQLELCNSIQTAALVYNVIFLFFLDMLDETDNLGFLLRSLICCLGNLIRYTYYIIPCI